MPPRAPMTERLARDLAAMYLRAQPRTAARPRATGMVKALEHLPADAVLGGFLEPRDVLALRETCSRARAAASQEACHRRICLELYLPSVLGGVAMPVGTEPSWRSVLLALAAPGFDRAVWRRNKGKGAAVAALRSDHCDYAYVAGAEVVFRSGGRYFFRMAFASAEGASIETAPTPRDVAETAPPAADVPRPTAVLASKFVVVKVRAGAVPVARHGHTTTALRGGAAYFLFGGSRAGAGSALDADGGILGDCHVLELDGGASGLSSLRDARPSGAWLVPTCAGSPPGPRRGHAATVTGRGIAITGGSLAHAPIAEFEVFIANYDRERCLVEWSKLQKRGNLMRCPRHSRCSHKALLAPDGESLIVFGGQRVGHEMHMTDRHSIPLDENASDDRAWSVDGLGRRGHGLVVVGPFALVWGGYWPHQRAEHTHKRMCGVSEVLDMRGGPDVQWSVCDTTPGEPPPPRHGFALSLTGAAVSIAGGFDESGERLFDDGDAWELDLVGDETRPRGTRRPVLAPGLVS